jgi:hypothetical protein
VSALENGCEIPGLATNPTSASEIELDPSRTHRTLVECSSSRYCSAHASFNYVALERGSRWGKAWAFPDVLTYPPLLYRLE